MNNAPSWIQFQQAIITYRILLLIILGIGGIAAGPGLSKLNVSVNIDDFFLEDDPILAQQDRFEELFKTKEFIGVLVQSDDVFSRETLTLINNTSHQLETTVPFAEEAITITNFSSPVSPQTTLQFENNVLISSDEEIENYKNFYTNDDTLKGVFFSENNREAWILLPLRSYSSPENWNGKESPFFSIGKETYDTVQELQRSIDNDGTTLTATGFSVYAYRKKVEMLNDLMIILIVAAIVALLLSMLIFRSIQKVFATLLIIALSVVYVLGIQGWLGIQIDSAFISVPILLTVGVGIGYTVHIISFFTQALREDRSRVEAITSAVSQCATPIFFTAFTTTVALFSFLFVNIKPIRWVGYSSALCIIAVYILSIVLFPIIMSFGNTPLIHKHSTKQARPTNPILSMFIVWASKHGSIILIVFLAATTLGIYGALKIQVDLDTQKMTGTKLPHMKDIIQIEESQIASNEILDLVITTKDNSTLNLATLQNISALENNILSLALVKRTNSLAQNLAQINYISHANNDAFNTLPSNEEELNALLTVIDAQFPDNIASWHNTDDNTTRISIELSTFSSKTINEHIETIGTFIEEIFPQDTSYFFSGSTFQMAVMNQYVTKGLIQSLFTALLTISMIMIVVFRSIKVGLIAMIPNVFPVIIAGGIMGALNIPLEFVTMTVAPLILGLSVDDTIHLVWHLRETLAHNKDFSQSITHTFSVVGNAITKTTIILCLTFLVFTFSKANNIIYMGIIICAGLFAAYISDMLVTPILIHKITHGKHPDNKT